MNFGRSRARLYDSERRKVTFDHVAGADEEKYELQEIVEFLKDPKNLTNWAPVFPKAYCWSARREQAKRSWPGCGR